ncbi:hypothetical protein [Clostridium ihumii]|uniref:hypothetical protein n=1 Tax=Clostridium ihumii TaxID=1470356 RepID=UPI003D3324A6
MEEKLLDILCDKTEKILYDYDIINAEITNLELEITHLKNMQEGYKSIDYSNITGGKTNKVISPVENIIFSGNDKKIKELTNILENKKLVLRKLENAMRTLDDIEKTIIEYKYRKKMSWKAISQKTYFNRNRCSNINSIAIKKLANIIFCAKMEQKQSKISAKI